MSINLLEDRVLVRPVDTPGQTIWGLLLPEKKEQPQEGTILAVGPGKRLSDGQRAPMELAVGDRVLFQRYAGTPCSVDGSDHLILREQDVLVVLGGEDEHALP